MFEQRQATLPLFFFTPAKSPKSFRMRTYRTCTNLPYFGANKSFINNTYKTT
jgi:hypothetical protein